MRRRAALVMALALFALHLSPSATTAQMPLMIVNALGTALLAYVLARHVLGSDPLAWPLTVFVAITLSSAALLLGNARPDLVANGIALLAVSLLALVALSRAQTI